MRTIFAAVAVAGALASGVRAETSSDRWIHVRVDDNDEGHARVDIQVPIGMVSGLLPMLEHEVGSGEININGKDVDLVRIRNAWTALRQAKDGQYVTVRDDDADVRIAKNGGLLLIHVDDKEDGDRVRIKLPLPVVDAALSGGETLDLDALIRALEKAPSGDIVTVDNNESHVRIWIDSAPAPARQDLP